MDKVKDALNPGESGGGISGEGSHFGSSSGGGISGQGSHLGSSNVSTEAAKGTGITSSIPGSGEGSSLSYAAGAGSRGHGSTGQSEGLSSYLPGTGSTTGQDSTGESKGLSSYLPGSGSTAATGTGAAGGAGVASYLTSNTGTSDQTSSGENKGISSILPGGGSSTTQQNTSGESRGVSSYIPGGSSAAATGAGAAGGAGVASYLGSSAQPPPLQPGYPPQQQGNTANTSSSESKGVSSYLPGSTSSTSQTQGSTAGGGVASYVPGVRPDAVRQDSEPGNSAYVENSYKARSYQLPARNDLPGSMNISDTGPHDTETANRLDPRIGAAAAGAGVLGAGAAGTAAVVGSSEQSKPPERQTATPERFDSTDPVSPTHTRSTAPPTETSSSKITPPGDFARDDPVSPDDSRSTGYGTAAAVAGGSAAAGAAGYGAYEAGKGQKSYTTELLGTGGSYGHHEITHEEQEAANARGIVLDIVKDESGRERVVMSGPGMDTAAPPRSSVDSSKVSEGGSPKTERRGSKLKSMLGLNKDKSRSSTEENRGESPRQSYTTDDTSYGSTTTAATGGAAAAGGAGAYSASDFARDERTSTTDSGVASTGPAEQTPGVSGEGFTLKYNKLPGEEHPEWAQESSVPQQTSTEGESSSKGSRRLSDLLRRKDPNKLHKEPPETSSS